MEDYDFTLAYHLRKANVVADALSRKASRVIATIALEDWKRNEVVESYNLQYYDDYHQAVIYNLVSTPVLVQQIKQNQ